MDQNNQKKGPIDLSGALQNVNNPVARQPGQENLSEAKAPEMTQAMKYVFGSTKNGRQSALVIFGIVITALIIVIIFVLNTRPKENFSSSPQLPSPPENTPR